MHTTSSICWRCRSAFLLSTFLGLGWGILLGWYQVRLNAYREPLLTLVVTMPLVFWGSMGTGLAFNLMLPRWHKLKRLLVAAGLTSLGLPWGILWALLGDGVEPLHLLRSTGWTPWQLEWGMALVGLGGGMFPRWLLVFLRPLANRVGGILSAPMNMVGAFGHTIVGLPRRGMPATLLNPLPSRGNGARVSPLPRRQSVRRRRRRVAAVPAAGNGNGARIVAHVEDRCPYCFDVVKRNDPRGVRICEICHTPHHADCWAITGKCQVPHLNP